MNKKVIRLNENDVLDSLENIEKKNRSYTVNDNDYGRINTADAESRDMSVYAVIEYDQNGNIVFEEYSKLIEILDERVNKYSKVSYVVNPETQEKTEVKSISGNYLVNLRLSEREHQFAIEYLTRKGFLIRGRDSSIDGNFDGYRYMSTYKSIKLPEAFNLSKNFEVFYQYKMFKNEVSRLPEGSLEKTQMEEKLVSIRNSLIEGNMRLVCDIVRKQMPMLAVPMDEEDIYQIAYECLFNFIENFDVELGYAFSSYIYNTLMFKVLREYEKYKTFCTPTYLFEYINKIHELQNSIYMSTGRNASVQELSLASGISERIIQRVLLIDGIKTVDSYETYYEEREENASFEDYNDDDCELEIDSMDSYLLAPSVYDVVFAENFSEEMQRALDCLTTREALVLKMLYGFEGDVMTYEQVGKELNLNRERIRQIENKAIRKMRHPRISKNLRMYYNGPVADEFVLRRM